VELLIAGFCMKLVISFGLVLLLVLAGAARSLWSDDTDKLASAAKNGSTATLGEESESWNDERLIGSFPLASAVTSHDSSPLPSLFVSTTSVELNSIRDNSRIYKLNSRFLI
jgi:hypothetical protein